MTTTKLVKKTIFNNTNDDFVYCYMSLKCSCYVNKLRITIRNCNIFQTCNKNLPFITIFKSQCSFNSSVYFAPIITFKSSNLVEIVIDC